MLRKTKKEVSDSVIEYKQKGLLEQAKEELQEVSEQINALYVNAQENELKANVERNASEWRSVSEIRELRNQAIAYREEAKFLDDTVRTKIIQKIDYIEQQINSLKCDIEEAETELSNCESYRKKYKKEYENRLEMIEHTEKNAQWKLEHSKTELLKYEGDN